MRVSASPFTIYHLPFTHMRSVIVGTAGHIDHGKTTLVRALTGVDADRLPEEKRRGITIDLGFAELELDGVRVGFIDVPGHERFVKNMLAGAEAEELVRGSFLEGAPVLTVSARAATGLEELKTQLRELALRVPARPA